jgi:hypothetical protein
MCSKLLRCCSLLLLLCSTTFCSKSSLTASETQVLETIAGASVRIFASGGSLGSGSIYQKTEEGLYILTNAHVAGGVNSKVRVEFWFQGRLSTKVPAVVTKSLLSNRSDHDYAVVFIKREDVGGYFDVVTPIPLAEKDFTPDFSKLYSAGCPQGTWQTHWIGHGTGAMGNQAVRFVPMPANGRSGSAIYQVLDGGAVVQVGVITYRTRAPGKDGTSETDGEGIAQTIGHIRSAMDSADFSMFDFRDEVDDSKYELVPAQECPGGICPPVEESFLVVGEEVERYTLRYVDPYAEGRSGPELKPTEIANVDGKLTARESASADIGIFPSLPKKLQQDCPDGSCPLPQESPVQPQPQTLPQQREIFPNLPPILPEPLAPKLQDKAQGLLEQLGKKQEEQTGLLRNIGERFDRRMDIVEQQLEIQRHQLQNSIKESVENVEKGIIGRLLDLPLIRQVRWLVRVLFWPLVLFAIWWVPAFLLNLGPLWFLPVIRAVKGFFQAALAGIKEIFSKKQAAAPSEAELAAMIADIMKKREGN